MLIQLFTSKGFSVCEITEKILSGYYRKVPFFPKTLAFLFSCQCSEKQSINTVILEVWITLKMSIIDAYVKICASQN